MCKMYNCWKRRKTNRELLFEILKQGEYIMSALSEWAGRVGPKLDAIQTGLDALQELVKQLQDSAGTVTPEDQALIDQIEAKVNAIASDASGETTPPVA